jgi:hypothetical protein
MSDIRTFANNLPWFQYGNGSKYTAPTYASGTSVTFGGSVDATAFWHAGRRVKAVGSSTGTIYGKVSSSSYSAPNTTVNFTWDSGSLSNETLTISASLPVTGAPLSASSISGGFMTNAGANTTFGVGAATPAATGSGVSFPATQSASSDVNTLDDYEEGTWTPALSASTTPPSSVTYSTQTGYYTKIGNAVFIRGRMTLTSAGTGGVGNTRISGLPFTTQNLAVAIAINIASITLDTGYTSFTGIVLGNSTMLQLNENGSNVASQAVPIGSVQNAADFSFSGLFFV